ncbi:MAG: chemotaxis protein CheW [bacterium]|nr:chemotaxis protein CheW [bacterium]
MTDQINKKADKANNKQKKTLRKVDKENMEILFFRLGETEFCARKDDLIDITGGNIIYHLPLTPAYFDGVVDLNGATTYVFDLAALAGINSITSAHEGTLLIVSKKNPPTAFRVDEISGEAIIKNEAIIPMPPYLKSEFIDSCAIHEERLTPIINLRIILKSILSTRIEASAKLSISPPAEISKKKLSDENIKLFLLGEETFASLDFDSKQPLLNVSDITAIPGTPDFVLGISLFQRMALTIIDTSLRLNRKKSDGRKILISKIGKNLFGFIVDAEKKRRKTTIDKTLELPRLTSKKWMTSAIFTGKEIIPILKLGSLLSPEEPVTKETLAKSYRPDHSFEQSFFKQKVNITEFILMGKHHALPAAEVKEVLALKRYRNLPGLPSIVIGVSEHKGTLLPVIDIEACFGIKSEMTKSWKMIHLENGDFSALVTTKAALGEKELPPELHRNIPLMMKHRFLYGCYPNNEAKMISLALNVYKMAVYFDEEILREIFKSPASVTKEDKRICAGELSPKQSDPPLNAPAYLNGQINSLPPEKDTIGVFSSAEEQKGGLETPNKEHDASINTEKPEIFKADTPFKSLGESSSEEESLIPPEQPGEASVPEDEQKKRFESIQNTEEKTKEPDAIASKKSNPKNGVYTEELKHTKSRGPMWITVSIFLLICITLFSFFSPGRDAIKKERNAKPQTQAPNIYDKIPPAEKRKTDYVVPKAAAIQEKDYIKKPEAIEPKTNPAPEKQKPSTPIMPVETTKPVPKSSIQTPGPKKWKRNKNKYYPPLGEFDFYTVEEGDTLWDIAGAYSKNPYDYNLVAEDNKIIDPDLILPGQRLRLQKKLKVDKTALPEQNKISP